MNCAWRTLAGHTRCGKRASERERLYIDSTYYMIATGERDKAEQVYRLWRRIYPRDDQTYRDQKHGTTKRDYDE
jgi:hypothetical protein